MPLLLLREPKEALEPDDEEPGPVRELELKELCWPLPENEEVEGAPYWELGAEPERSLDEKPLPLELPKEKHLCDNTELCRPLKSYHCRFHCHWWERHTGS